MAIEFTVDHDHTYAAEGGIQQLIGWITFSLGTYPGDFRVRDLGAGMPRTMNIPPRRGWLAPDGHLYQDQTLAQPCRLVANDPAFNLRHLTYRADFALTTLAGDPVAVPHTFFSAPSADSTLPLTKVMSDPYQPVMEIRAKVYTEDIIDAGDFGQDVLFTGSTEEFWDLAGTVPSTSLPSYVDDVLEFTNLAAFPGTGETGKIYLDLSTGDSYRWSGSTYVRISDRITASGITDSTKFTFPKICIYSWYELTQMPTQTAWFGFDGYRYGEQDITERAIKYFALHGLDVMWTLMAPQTSYTSVAALVADTVGKVEDVLGAYGPRGTYWADNPTVPYRPITEIKVLNEPNFWWPHTGVNTVAASGNGTVATLTLAEAPSPAITVGEWITVSGVTPSGYNGDFVVTAASGTSVSYTGCSATGAQTVAGHVSYREQVAKDYATLLVATYDAIKAQWPEVTVVTGSGGAQKAGVGWAEMVLANLDTLGRLDAFDAFGDQTYTRPLVAFDQVGVEGWGSWTGQGALREVQELLRGYGLDKPLWITETGVQLDYAEGGLYTNPADFMGQHQYASQDVQAANTIRTAMAAARMGVPRVYFMGPADTDGTNLGWWDTDAGTLSVLMDAAPGNLGSSSAPPRKVATAMRMCRRLLTGSTQLEILLDGGTSSTLPFVYRFTTPRGRVTVAWCQTAGTHSIPVDPDVTQRVTDQVGTPIEVIGGASTYAASLSELPIFIAPIPPRTRIASTVDAGDSASLGFNTDADYLTFVNTGSTAVMPTAVGNTALYKFVNLDSGDAEVATGINTVALLHGEGSNGSTTITDSGLLASDWTAHGTAAIATAQSKFGSASIAISGAGSYIRASADAEQFAFGGDDFTVELFVRFSSVSGTVVLFDFRPGGANGNYMVLYFQSDAKLRFYNEGSPRIYASTAFTTGTWYHVAVSRVSGVTKLFIDGVQEGGDYTDPMVYAAGAPTVGASGDASLPMAGWVDEVRITKGIAKYAAGFTPPVSALTNDGTLLTLGAGGQLELVSDGTTWQEI